jgi:hypothetical protein
MRSAVSERCRELAAVATRIADLVDAEGSDLLPGMLVARVAVTADKAASDLSSYLALLSSTPTRPATKETTP